MRTTTSNLYPDLSLTVSEAGSGRPVLVLHGGGGPATTAGLAGHLARGAHVLRPVHPGWDGTERPAGLTGVDGPALAYLRLLGGRGPDDVLVVGSSLGGWVAAEMALRDTAGRIGGLVLIDAVGVHVEGEPLTDVFALDARGLAEHSWHDADRFHVDPATLPAAELARRQAEMATMRVLAGDPYMHDPGLLARLGGVHGPTAVLWGRATASPPPRTGRPTRPRSPTPGSR